jgi:hypothetical protein
MLKNILDVARKLVGAADCGSIALTDSDTGALIPRVGYPEGSGAAQGYVPGLAAWAARARETARVPDMSLTPWAKIYGDLNVRSELAAPILVGEQQFPEVRVWYNHNKVLVKHSRFIGSR